MSDDGSLPVARGKRGNNFAIRHKLIENRNGACEVCGFDCEFCLQAHHIVPISQGGTNDLSNLALLCANCHAAVEKMKTAQWSRSVFRVYTDSQYEHLIKLSGSSLAAAYPRAWRVAAMVNMLRYGIVDGPQ